MTKYIKAIDFLNSIKNPLELPSLILMLSEDNYELRSCYGSLTSKLLATDFQSKNIDMESLKQELESLSLFEDYKIIVIKNIQEASKALLNYLEEYCLNPLEKISIILTGTKINSRKLPKLFEERGALLSILALKPWEKEEDLKKWIIEKLKKKGKSCCQQTPLLLINSNKADKEQIIGELEKLVLYVGKRSKIDKNDFLAICILDSEENSWKLRDSIFARQHVQATAIAYKMIHSGESLPSIIASLYYSFKTALQIMTLFKYPNGINEISKKFPYLKGRNLEKQISSIKAYGPRSLKKALLTIAEYEFKAKNDISNGIALLELLILNLTKRDPQV